jgi:hypothetical protein
LYRKTWLTTHSFYTAVKRKLAIGFYTAIQWAPASRSSIAPGRASLNQQAEGLVETEKKITQQGRLTRFVEQLHSLSNAEANISNKFK